MTKKELEEKLKRIEAEMEVMRIKIQSLESKPIVNPFPICPNHCPLTPIGPQPLSPWYQPKPYYPYQPDYEPFKVWCNTCGSKEQED